MNKINEKVAKETEALLHDDAAIIGVYEKVLAGDLKRFPPYTWELPNSLYYAKIITRYLFEHKLHWNIEDIKENFNQSFIKKYRILGMLKALFKDNQFAMIDNVYPDKIKPWEYKRSKRGVWESKETREEALRWLFEVKLQWNIEDIKENLTQKTFMENGFMGCFKFYNESPFEVVNAIYPNQIHPWELKRVVFNYWDAKENRAKATKWLIEEKLGWGMEDVKKQLSRKTFIDNGLAGLLTLYNGSPYDAFSEAYPNTLHPWELHHVGPVFWQSDENKKTALKWLFEEKLGWDIDKLNHTSAKEIREVIIANGLGGLTSKHFQDSAYEIVKFLYPKEEFDVLKTTMKRKSVKLNEEMK